MITATYTARNAEIAPSLGRNLSSGANGTATVQLIPERHALRRSVEPGGLPAGEDVHGGARRGCRQQFDSTTCSTATR